MGNCMVKLTPQEKAAKAKSNAIGRGMNKQGDKDNGIIKVLLLGTGESGKSTIFKQMQILYCNGFKQVELERFVKVVRNNIIVGIQAMIYACEEFELDLSEKAIKIGEKIDEVDGLEIGEWSEELTEEIKYLWEEEENIKEIFNRRAEYQLSESVKYFIEQIDRISKDDYLPTAHDILYARLRTSGIVEKDFELQNKTFRFLDVGGQRNERRKWIHCFEDVKAILFIAALSEYDQTLFEDEKSNRLHESIKVFGEIVENDNFRDTNIILFLNKEDLFKAKVENVSIKSCFPDYPEDLKDYDYKDVRGYIEQQYRQVHESKNDGELFVHYTTATDTDLIKRVLSAITAIIINDVFKDTGFIAD